MIEAFRPTVRVRLSGDPAAVADWAGLRALALRELEVMRRTNVHDLPVYSRTLRLDSGESIVCRRTGSLDSVDILVAPHRTHRGARGNFPGRIRARTAISTPFRSAWPATKGWPVRKTPLRTGIWPAGPWGPATTS